jgi:hypothetical protein
MIPLRFDYATPSALESSRERALLGLTADARRPVRFHARVEASVLSLRIALQALGELVWSSDQWLGDEEYRALVLDPVVTVHPDRVFFEAFSQDHASAGVVIADRALFAPEGEVRCGTTNVDFTAWLWAALAEMRTSRETWLRVEAAGLEVRTVGGGGRFERKVDLPDDWVRAFLDLQAAMAHPGTRLRVRPVDLLAAIRFLRHTKAKVSPRALRYEMLPGQDARLVLEPWEHVVRLKGAEHGYDQPRTIRTWGRRRLRLLEPLLPYAEHVDVYLKGRAMPSFYAVRLPGVTYVLALSGTSEAGFAQASLGLLGAAQPTTEPDLARALRELDAGTALSVPALASRLAVSNELAAALLARLTRRGQALYDVERREYRHRELFPTPAREDRLFPPDERAEAAERLLAAGRVEITALEPRETRKRKRLKTPEGPLEREVVYRDWAIEGRVDAEDVQVVLNDAGRIIFGTCGCAEFRDHGLGRGPCPHLLALHVYAARGSRLQDLPSSVPALVPPRPRPAAAEGDGEPGEEDLQS